MAVFNPQAFLFARILQAIKDTEDTPSAFREGHPLYEYLVRRMFFFSGLKQPDIELLLANPPAPWVYQGMYTIGRLGNVRPYGILRDFLGNSLCWAGTVERYMFWGAISDYLYDTRSTYDAKMSEGELAQGCSDCWGLNPFRSLAGTRTEFAPICVSHPEHGGLLDHWVAREAYRLVSGQYEAPPWYDDFMPIAGHFAHCSLNSPGKITFTENATKGAADIQVSPTRPGRYLARFYPEIGAERVKEYAARVNEATQELHFATTPDEIEEVYIQGPDSCMSHAVTDYESHIHPVRIYGAGDLAVAYLKNGRGDVSDRVLCWPEKKLYGRLYGAGDGKLQRMLEAQGFSAGRLTGAKMLKIMCKAPNGRKRSAKYVMPYIDVDGRATDMGDHFVLGMVAGGVSTYAGETCGYTEWVSPNPYDWETEQKKRSVAKPLPEESLPLAA